MLLPLLVVHFKYICTRLNIFSNELGIISGNQTGFRKEYSTQDNIFVLHALIELHFVWKKIFCTFVDFRKAFDTVWRTGLWKKLLRSEINGKCFKVIFNMYILVSNLVFNIMAVSRFFSLVLQVFVRVKICSFSLLDLLKWSWRLFLSIRGIPLENIRDTLESELHVYYKLFVILYADDTVILSENKDGLQKA